MPDEKKRAGKEEGTQRKVGPKVASRKKGTVIKTGRGGRKRKNCHGKKKRQPIRLNPGVSV